ncbi:hypothetical protein MNBD_GAMMA23-360 [hydrothermal vent metagenome]|uniref:NodB homology domain-containing protein n=1 Tax=hydrothermal vent metagenome TaxID=652676 RepID=A0A3B0ZZA4_9ZZZZ
MKAIITFHSLDQSGSVLSYPPKLFANLLDSLTRSEVPILSLDELLLDETKAGITFTFDDGMKTVFTEALPILQDFNVPAHLYLTTGAVGKDNRWPTQPASAPGFEMLAWDEIEKLHAANIYIDSHTNSHPDMRTLSQDELEDECGIADKLIEERLGRQPQYFAYPYGYKNSHVCDFSRNRYKATVTTDFRVLCSTEDCATLPRLDAYYLQPKWLIKNLNSPLSKSYIALRGWIRTVRGKQ